MASLESNEGTGKLVVVAVVVLVVEGKLFNDEKFGVGRPNGGNAPNVGIDGKPNGRAQGRSKEKKKEIYMKIIFLSHSLFEEKKKKPYY